MSSVIFVYQTRRSEVVGTLLKTSLDSNFGLICGNMPRIRHAILVQKFKPLVYLTQCDLKEYFGTL